MVARRIEIPGDENQIHHESDEGMQEKSPKVITYLDFEGVFLANQNPK